MTKIFNLVYFAVLIISCLILTNCSKNSTSPTQPAQPTSIKYYLYQDKQLSTVQDTSKNTYNDENFRGGSTCEFKTAITGDIPGGNYKYNLWAWAVGSSFDIDIMLKQNGKETVLAEWKGITTTDQDYYVQLKDSLKGIDPATTTGDTLILKFTHTGPYMNWVSIRYSKSLESFIEIGS